MQQLVVDDDRVLASLLQVFEDETGKRRQVLFLALAAGEQEFSDAEVVATLRHQLQRLFARELGTRTVSAPLEPARMCVVAPVVPLQAGLAPAPFDEEPPAPEAAFAGIDDGGFAVAAER